jgi:RNA polymerase sigma factor for flagellar operon FliA
VSIEGCQVTDSRSGRGSGLEVAPDRRVRHPITALHRQEMRQAAIRGLQDKEKQVLVMYYYDEMTMREIGQVLGLSESRVCQIHNQVIKFLRRKFEELGLDGSLEEGR